MEANSAPQPASTRRVNGSSCSGRCLRSRRPPLRPSLRNSDLPIIPQDVRPAQRDDFRCSKRRRGASQDQHVTQRVRQHIENGKSLLRRDDNCLVWGLRPRLDILSGILVDALASAASFVLPISNPANLVVFHTGMPPLGRWLADCGVPSLLSIIVTFPGDTPIHSGMNFARASSARLTT